MNVFPTLAQLAEIRIMKGQPNYYYTCKDWLEHYHQRAWSLLVFWSCYMVLSLGI